MKTEKFIFCDLDYMFYKGCNKCKECLEKNTPAIAFYEKGKFMALYKPDTDHEDEPIDALWINRDYEPDWGWLMKQLERHNEVLRIKECVFTEEEQDGIKMLDVA
jgi:hypothetical protein